LKQSLLYISYYFPPIHSIASIRNAHLVEELRAYFSQIDVITTDNYQLFPIDEYPLTDVNIHAVATLDYRTFMSRRSKHKVTIHHGESVKNNAIVSSLIKLNDTFPFSLLLGEGGLRYIYNAYRKASSIINNADKKTEITIFSSYRSTANIVVAYLLKKNFPSVRWVNNFHDVPISYSDRPSILHRMEAKNWKRLLEKSTLNIAVSDGVAKELDKLNPRILSIPNGITVSSSTASNNHIFTIAYTGSLYGDRRDPRFLFEVLSTMIQEGLLTLSNFQLIYAGKDGSKWDIFLNEFLALHKLSRNLGNISRAEVNHIQSSAHINLLLTWSTLNEKGILTGKLYEYLGVRNPILAIVNGDQDEEINEIFNRLSCGQALYTSDNQLQSKIYQFISNQLSFFNNQQHILSLTPTEELDKLTWAAQVRKLMEHSLMTRTPNNTKA